MVRPNGISAHTRLDKWSASKAIGDRCGAVIPAPLAKLVDPRTPRVVFLTAVRTTARAPCTRSVLKCWLPRLLIPIITLRSPLEYWRGTSPSQAAKCRPFLKSDPSPIAAIIAVAVFGPIPRILAILWQTSLALKIASILLMDSQE
jgi:hypothetical protein